MNFKFISKYLNNIIKLFIYIPHLMYIYIYIHVGIYHPFNEIRTSILETIANSISVP